MFFNDTRGPKTPSYLDHYFHFIGEMFLGAWRMVTAAGDGQLPARLMYRAEPEHWRDRAGLTTWFQQSIMPSTAIEDKLIWDDRARSGTTFLFDKIVLIDRWAAHKFGQEPRYLNKATGDVPNVPAPLNWLHELRQGVVQFSVAEGCNLARRTPHVPIVTYVNRQLTGRRLTAQSAEDLVQSLQALDDADVVEFYNAQMESLSRAEQFCLAAKSDLLVGVHGNGLSHMLWMKPGSAVLEIMNAGGFAPDYALLAQIANHRYFAIHNDSVFTEDKWRRPDGWGVTANAGFHGSSIEVSGAFVAGLVRNLATEGG